MDHLSLDSGIISHDPAVFHQFVPVVAETGFLGSCGADLHIRDIFFQLLSGFAEKVFRKDRCHIHLVIQPGAQTVFVFEFIKLLREDFCETSERSSPVFIQSANGAEGFFHFPAEPGKTAGGVTDGTPQEHFITCPQKIHIVVAHVAVLNHVLCIFLQTGVECRG